jgi:DNA polymerase III subunit epsilon
MSKMLDGFIELVKSGVYVVLDTETTGLHDGEICQIAVVDSAGSVLMDTLVKTVRPIPAEATHIHGITNEMVANADGWEQVSAKLLSLLTGKPVIVYNAVYDRKMLHQSAEKAGLPKVEWKSISSWHCAMEAFAEEYGDYNSYHGSYRWQPLYRAARHYNIEQREAHTALDDCLTTLAIIKAMAKV